MPDDARAGTTDFLDGQLDARFNTLIAVVHDGDRPRHLGAFGVIGRVVVSAVVSELLHPAPRSPATSSDPAIGQFCPSYSRFNIDATVTNELRETRPSVLAEADGGDHIGKLACLPRITAIFRDVNLSPETDDGTTAQGIEVPGVDVAGEPFGQTLFAADER
jgi:hypothetical protein